MCLIFIHGVNTRETDKDYETSKSARQKLFRDFVVPAARKYSGSFDVAEDIYWGDLGAKFAWGLTSVPPTSVFQSLGPGTREEIEHVDLLLLIAGDEPLDEPESDPNPEAILREAAETRAGDVVRAVFAPEAAGFDPSERVRGRKLDENETARAAEQGQQFAILVKAIEQFAQEAEGNPELILGPDDSSILNKIRTGVESRYKQLAEQEAPQTDEQTLGTGGDAIAWARGRVQTAVQGAGRMLARLRDTPLRGASLLLNKAYRDDASRRAMRFFGDVFEYLHQGPDGPIARRVREKLRAASKTASGEREPFVIVSHSFGASLVYEALTSGHLDDIVVDLWVTVGAQTSLFAEMRLFKSSLDDLPSEDRPVLGRPKQVRRWANVFDVTDVFSYLHTPVFGDELVSDIAVREGANLKTAHGHYFATESFYRTVAEQLEAVLKTA
jgi:hypothetical protein